MDSFFEIIFSDYHLSSEGETQVKCPFPHYTASGEPYYESRASAGVNLIKGVFHCFTCGAGHSETSFIAKYMNLDYGKAKQFKRALSKSIDTKSNWHQFTKQLKETPTIIEVLDSLGFSEEVIKELQLGFSGKGGIDFPVFIFDQLVDIATYRKDSHPKVIRTKGSTSGMIIPYDTWRESTRPTVICAGEKDMAIGRTFGLNAITITGGEGTIPEFFLNDFKGRTVYIVYDNDDAGITGAIKLAIALKPYVSKLKILDLSETCTEKGEDLWDYFKKYNKTLDDFKKLIVESKEFTENDYETEKERQFPTIPLLKATEPLYIGKMVRSNIQVSSVMEDQFQMPLALTGKKEDIVTKSDVKNTVDIGYEGEWFFNENNAKDMFYLIDSNLKEDKIKQHQKILLGVAPKEECFRIKIEDKATIFKAIVKDLVTPDTAIDPQEILAFSIGKKLEHGKKYRLTYKLIPHPMEGQKTIMVIFNVEDANDTITNFKLNEEKIQHLRMFQVQSSLEERIDQNVQMVKGMIGFDYNDTLIKFVDFTFHSALKFHMGRYKDLRGTLDALLVGESRTGKSSTAEEFIKRYNVGEKVTLPTSTLASVIGGSDKIGGSYFTRAGSLPLNHQGLVVLEELQKSRDPEILKKLTEIKSSGIAQIGRVTGKVELPCVVRMLSITNPKYEGSAHKPISSYPNGVEIVTDLVGAAEDIARFDMIAISADMADKELDFSQEFPEPYDNKYYQTRIQWIWSRKADQIIIPKNVEQYLASQSNKLNKEFPSHIKLFGTEVWKKIARLAIAIAGYVVSTDNSFENIIVHNEHIDYAVKFLRSLYDNDTFRFKQFVQQELRFKTIDEDGVAALQSLYNINPTLILHLENESETSRNNMQALAGSDMKDFSTFVSHLVSALFIRIKNHTVYPTERFRKGMKLINRKTQIPKIGRLSMNVEDDVV